MTWVGLDRSGAALTVARANARRHAVLDRVHFLQSDLLAALKPTAAFALLVANLPYVPRAEWERLPREIKAFEPPGALLGGEDGLDLIRRLIHQTHQYLRGGRLAAAGRLGIGKGRRSRPWWKRPAPMTGCLSSKISAE